MARPTDYKGEETLKKVEEYIEECQDDFSGDYKKVKLPTIAGLALKLGVTERTVHNWAEKHPQFFQSLQRVNQLQKERLQSEGLAGNYNSTIAKLILSANHGLREGKDVTSRGEKIEGNKIVFEDFSE